jgi:hypothetical protein
VLPTKKKKAPSPRAAREALPVIEVDVDDDLAIADVAEALVTAILSAAVERGTGVALGAAPKKKGAAKKSAAKRVAAASKKAGGAVKGPRPKSAAKKAKRAKRGANTSKRGR